MIEGAPRNPYKEYL